jgi:metal-sulfur cluster biosynthetic enzyme
MTMGILDKVKETFGRKKEDKIEERKEVTETKETTEPKKPERMPDTKEAMEADTQKKPIVTVLKDIEDPELGVDIWTLGLIYNLDVKEKTVDVRMTFTSIMCPVGPMIVQTVKDKVTALESVDNVNVEVTFSPAWQPTDELREMLGV